MSSAAEDAIAELEGVLPEIFCGDDFGDSARLIFEASWLLHDHLHHHSALPRIGIPGAGPASGTSSENQGDWK